MCKEQPQAHSILKQTFFSKQFLEKNPDTSVNEPFKETAPAIAIAVTRWLHNLNPFLKLT